MLAARLATGHVQAGAVVPEGHEDVSLEGATPWHIQIKSRGHLSGEFPVHEATDHILKVWKSHLARDEPDAQLGVVFERDIKGEQLPSCMHGSGVTTGESLPEDSKLLQSLRNKGKANGFSETDIGALLSSTVFAVISWDAVTEETLDCLMDLDDLSSLPPSSLKHIALLLRVEIGDASNENASRAHGDRRALGRTEIVGKIQEFASQIDLNSLEAAIRDGVCEPLELGEGVLPDSGRFYEGEATQPSHVASGLVVHRPDVVSQIKSGLGQKSAVVITGPSGVGKSAVLWTIPDEMPNVLWFRVRRLAPDDVSSIIRLARAYNASAQNQIGFLVDCAGAGDFRGWHQLRSEAAAVQGILLVATARNEDLALLGNMADCSTVEIRLDEHTAEVIHQGLVERGATTAPHWQEAFEDAGGLTLEFTHLLTSGMRLRDLIDDQVNQRMIEKRHSEINVLALVSAADRWSAEVSVSDIAAAYDLSDLEMREALDRLREEHLVVERDGWIGGLHRLRSTAICDSIHDRPPPTIDDSIRRVLPLISTSHLHRFIASLLREKSHLRDLVVATVSMEPLELDRAAAILQGLRLADFDELAKKWNEIAKEHEVPVTARPALFTFAVGQLEPPNLFPEQFQAAWNAIGAAQGQDSRSDFISTVGLDRVVELLVSSGDTQNARQLLAVLDGTGRDFTFSVEGALSSQPPLVSALQRSPLEALAEILATAYEVDPRLAQALVEAIGGENTVIERIRANCPWTIQLEIQEGNGNPVGFARLLHVSDAHQPNPENEVITLGEILLQCLPRIESIDVQALLPGNQEFVIGGFNLCAKQFKREQILASSGTAWNQARVRAACVQLAEPDTARLTAALTLLHTTCDLVHKIGTALVTGQPPNPDFDQQTSKLHRAGSNLPPPHRGAIPRDTAIMELRTPNLSDDLSGLITDITGNIIPRLGQGLEGYSALAAYTSDTVIDRHLEGSMSEPWHLIGIEGCPQILNKLRSVLEDLLAVVEESSRIDADIVRIRNSALAGTKSRALRRAAESCRKTRKQRNQRRREDIQRKCKDIDHRARVFDSTSEKSLREYRISIEVESLLEWYEAVGQLTASIKKHQHPGEEFLLVPLRNNRPVPMLAMRYIFNLWPEPHPEGLDSLSEAHPDQLAAAFDKAQLALQAISGICCLSEEQQDHEMVQGVADTANTELEAAYESLCEFPGDTVIDWLRSMIEGLGTHVQAECDGAPAEDGFAAQVALSLTSDEVTEYSALVLYAKCVALEWEIDPAAATQLLPDDGD